MTKDPADRPERSKPWMMRTYRATPRPEPPTSSTGPTWPRARPGSRWPSTFPPRRLRPRRARAAGEVGKVGVPVAHLGHMRQLLDGITGVGDEYIDDDQRHRGLAARSLRGQRPGRWHRPDPAFGTTQNDIVKEYLPGAPTSSPAAEPPADRRHHRLHGPSRTAVESGQRLQLPPPRGRGHPLPRAGLRAGHGDRDPRRCAPVGEDLQRRGPAGGRSDQLLRERRTPLRRRDLQDAGLHLHVEPHLRRALRGHRREAPAVSVSGCR